MTLSILNNAGDLRGKRVFLVVDWNLPIKDGVVIDDYRVRRSAKTLDFLRASGARTLMVAHRTDRDASLYPVYEYLKKTYQIVFAETIALAREALNVAAGGSFVMLENIRKIADDKEEENDLSFAKELASLADVYVNEGFSVSHRAHASIVGVPKFLPSYVGFLFEEEVAQLSRAFSPAHPALVILGGAKFETKLPLIDKFLSIADQVYVCGALANDIYKTLGFETGVSLLSSSAPDLNTVANNPKCLVPEDVIVKNPEGEFEKKVIAVGKNDRIVDIGEHSLQTLEDLVGQARFILWNGPLGEYERGFAHGTLRLAKIIAESKAESIVGGGDSLAAIAKLHLADKFSFVSTGGGAMLEFLSKGALPGIEALKKGIMNQES